MKRVPVHSRTLRAGFKGMRSSVDESVMDWDYSPAVLNYRIKNGVLTGELGLVAARGFHPTVPEMRHDYPALPDGASVKGIFHYRRRYQGNYDDRLVIQTTTGALYYTAVFATDTWHAVSGYTLTGDATAVSYNYGGKDVLLMSSPSSAFAVLDDASVKQVTSAPRFSSVTVHNERVYGTLNGESNQLWFSDDFDPENWTVSAEEGGYISFADECGDALMSVSFLGYLYIFREHGIYRLTAYGDQGEFMLKKLFTATGRIYKDTIALCGDRIMFLTDEGVFSFDGYNATPAMRELPKVFYPSYSAAAYHDGAYWLACTLSVAELEGGLYTANNALARFDIREGEISLLAGYDVTALCAVRSHTAADVVTAVVTEDGCRLASLSENGGVFGVATPKIYRTPFNDLSSSAFKTVREVTLTTRYDAELRVRTDEETHVYALAGADRPQTVFVGKSGKKIGLELRSSTGLCHITPPVVKLDITA